jgi:para-aminobenzoate synthetase component I
LIKTLRLGNGDSPFFNSLLAVDVQRISAGPLCGLTPLDVFRSWPKPFAGVWLDTGAVKDHEKAWSLLAFDPAVVVQGFVQKGFNIKLIKPSWSVLGTHKNIVRLLLQPAFSAPNRIIEGPPFQCGWVGVVPYENGFQQPSFVPSTASASFCLFSQILAYSHPDKTWWSCKIAPSATRRDAFQDTFDVQQSKLLAQFASAKNVSPNSFPSLDFQTVRSSTSRNNFRAGVERCLDYIRSGDIYQINLSHRLTAQWPFSAEDLYLALRQESPARFGAFLGAAITGCGAIASISPELLLRKRGRDVETRPIKGTRPRPANAAEAQRLRDELDRSEKERAELNMIVDLERNDLGRVCEYGSVRVTSPGDIETLPTLFHRVATVRGTLRERIGPRQLWKALFPGGSVTGAPKRRAMEIIRELETVPRGPYCGAIGWMDLNGDMEWNLAIRTAVHDAASQTVSYHAGSGIVADSIPDAEYEETLQKSAAFLRAVRGKMED